MYKGYNVSWFPIIRFEKLINIDKHLTILKIGGFLEMTLANSSKRKPDKPYSKFVLFLPIMGICFAPSGEEMSKLVNRDCPKGFDKLDVS